MVSNRLFLSIAIALSPILALGQEHPCTLCNAALEVAMQEIEFSSSRDLLEEFQRVYSLDESSYDEYKKNSKLGINLPEYGSGSYKSEKSRIESMSRKVEDDISYVFSLQEQQFFSSKFPDPIVLESWLACVRSCLGSPGLTVEPNDEKIFIVALSLPFGPVKSTKIVSINVTNAKLEGEEILKRGAKLEYGSSYSQAYSREDTTVKVSISISLKNEEYPLLKTLQPMQDLTPRYEMRWLPMSEDGELYYQEFRRTLTQTEFLGKRPSSPFKLLPWMKSSMSPHGVSGTFELTSKTGKIYKLTQSSDCNNWHHETNTISDSKNGFDYKFKFTPINNCSIVFHVYYKEAREVCVANCPPLE